MLLSFMILSGLAVTGCDNKGKSPSSVSKETKDNDDDDDSSGNFGSGGNGSVGSSSAGDDRTRKNDDDDDDNGRRSRGDGDRDRDFDGRSDDDDDDGYGDKDGLFLGDKTPLVLDLDRNGVIETLYSVNKKHVFFDVDNDGRQDKVEWISGNEAFLAADLNGNGKIDSGAELFGNGTYLKGLGNAINGFIALESYDSNKDGVIDGQDRLFKNLKVWQDINGNGKTEKNELASLWRHEVTKIHLKPLDVFIPASKDSSVRGKNSYIRGVSRFVTRDGASHLIADIYFKSPLTVASAQEGK